MDNAGESFPDIFPDEADLEGAYRFLRNPNVTFSKGVEAHLQSTAERVREAGRVLVIHDTTDFHFAGEREGLGFLYQESSQGFMGHFALAVSADEMRIPLGVLGVETYIRKGKPKRTPSYKIYRKTDRESLRWKSLVNDVAHRINGKAELIHVMDREGDIYEVLDEIQFKDENFVIRLSHDRALTGLPGRRISHRLESLEIVCEREVPLSHKKNKRKDPRKTPRNKRLAKLAFSAARVEIRRPLHHNHPHARSLTLNVVHIKELDVPEAEEPVDWKLITTLPIDNENQIIEIVDIYRSRWLIEEYFKALKSGCKYEARQLETDRTLLNALALFIPVAHRLLLLRNISRTAPDLPANLLLTKTQLTILKALPKNKLSQNPTARDALLEIARIGGHIKNNGDPGWSVIWRGYRKLLLYEVAWRAKK